MAEDELTPEKLAEQIRLLKIEDILLSTVSTLGQLAYAKLDAKELAQAQLAIDAIAAVLPTLEGHVGADVLRDFKQLLASARLSFANIVAASGSEPQSSEGAGPTPAEEAADTAASHETEAEASQESGSGSEPQSPDAENREDG